MATARQRAEWSHTASLAAVILNLFRGKGKKAVSPSQLNPFTAKATSRHSGGIPLNASSIGILRGAAKRVRRVRAAEVRTVPKKRRP